MSSRDQRADDSSSDEKEKRGPGQQAIEPASAQQQKGLDAKTANVRNTNRSRRRSAGSKRLNGSTKPQGAATPSRSSSNDDRFNQVGENDRFNQFGESVDGLSNADEIVGGGMMASDGSCVANASSSGAVAALGDVVVAAGNETPRWGRTAGGNEEAARQSEKGGKNTEKGGEKRGKKDDRKLSKTSPATSREKKRRRSGVGAGDEKKVSVDAGEGQKRGITNEARRADERPTSSSKRAAVGGEAADAAVDDDGEIRGRRDEVTKLLNAMDHGAEHLNRQPRKLATVADLHEQLLPTLASQDLREQLKLRNVHSLTPMVTAAPQQEGSGDPAPGLMSVTSDGVFQEFLGSSSAEASPETKGARAGKKEQGKGAQHEEGVAKQIKTDERMASSSPVDTKTQTQQTNNTTTNNTLSKHTDALTRRTLLEKNAWRINDNATPFVRGALVGAGSFGDIYRCKHIRSGNLFAMKIEDKAKVTHQHLKHEVKILKMLTMNNRNITEEGKQMAPKLIFSARDAKRAMMVVEIQGPSLEDLFNFCDRNFSFSTIFGLAIQTIKLLDWLHDQNFVHQDLKPDNFMLSKDKHNVVLIDFGMAKLWRNPRKHSLEHIPFRAVKGLTGTARYASINSHLGYELSRRDDIESLAHVILYFGLRKLPWQGLKDGSRVERMRRIGEIKQALPVDSLCAPLPSEFASFLGYSRKLEFTDRPDYRGLKDMFERGIDREVGRDPPKRSDPDVSGSSEDSERPEEPFDWETDPVKTNDPIFTENFDDDNEQEWLRTGSSSGNEDEYTSDERAVPGEEVKKAGSSKAQTPERKMSATAGSEKEVWASTSAKQGSARKRTPTPPDSARRNTEFAEDSLVVGKSFASNVSSNTQPQMLRQTEQPILMTQQKGGKEQFFEERRMQTLGYDQQRPIPMYGKGKGKPVGEISSSGVSTSVGPSRGFGTGARNFTSDDNPMASESDGMIGFSASDNPEAGDWREQAGQALFLALKQNSSGAIQMQPKVSRNKTGDPWKGVAATGNNSATALPAATSTSSTHDKHPTPDVNKASSSSAAVAREAALKGKPGGQPIAGGVVVGGSLGQVEEESAGASSRSGARRQDEMGIAIGETKTGGAVVPEQKIDGISLDNVVLENAPSVSRERSELDSNNARGNAVVNDNNTVSSRSAPTTSRSPRRRGLLGFCMGASRNSSQRDRTPSGGGSNDGRS